MAGLVPAIHVFLIAIPQDVDARHKAGHDERKTPVGCERQSPAPLIKSTRFLISSQSNDRRLAAAYAAGKSYSVAPSSKQRTRTFSGDCALVRWLFRAA